jgi:hypothetical protein
MSTNRDRNILETIEVVAAVDLVGVVEAVREGNLKKCSNIIRAN